MDKHEFLEPFKDQINKTKLKKVTIQAAKESTSLKESKFGGEPYLQKAYDYPRLDDRSPMMLLAQLNFSEIPQMAGYPTSGILQFFISAHDENYGLNVDNQLEQKGFRVLFHENIDEEGQGVPTYPFDENIVPFIGERKLIFTLTEELVPFTDYRYDELLGDVFDDDKYYENPQLEDAFDAYIDAHDGHGHKIGGYGCFAEYDPRGTGEEFKDHTHLLFQMDTDVENGIVFGEYGTASFFITKEDLLNRDFSRVLYNWDCC